MAKRLSKAGTIPLLVVAVVGIGISAAMFVVVRHVEQARVNAQFLLLANQRLIAVGDNVGDALEAVGLLGSYVNATPRRTFNRQGFKTFGAPTLAKHNYLRALEWIPKVGGDEREHYERLARADGMRNFVFTERGKDGTLAKAKSRDEYFPVFYVEPLAGNEPAVGYDLASDKARLAALATSRDTGQIVATAPIELVQDKSRQYGTLVFAPVYNRPVNNLRDRQRYLVGFTLGVFRINELVTGSTKPDLAELAEIHLFDITPGAVRQLYPKTSQVTLEQLHRGLHAELEFDVGGRRWLLLARPTAAETAAQSEATAFMALAAGLLLTALCFFYLRTRIKQSEQIVQAALAIEVARQRWTEAQRIAQLGSIEHLLGSPLWSVGEQARAMLDLPDDEVTGTLPALLRQVHRDDRARVMTELAAAEREGLSVVIDFEFQVGASQIRLIHALGKLLVSQTDGKTCMLVTLQDVTAYRAEQQERTKLLTILEQSPDFVGFVNTDGTVGYLNPAGRALIGVDDLQETRGKSIFDYEWPKDRRLHRDGFLTALQEGSWQSEYQLQHQKTGEPITVDMRVFSIVDGNGELLGTAGVCRDIRERKRAEQKLLESEARFQELAAAIHEVFWMTEIPSNRILYVSPAYEEIWGRPCAELYVDSFARLHAVHQDDRARVTHRLLEQRFEKALDLDYRVVRPDGSVRWVRDRVFPVRDSSGTIVRMAGVAADITEQRQANDALVATQRLLASIVDSSEDAIVSEDLKGVLTTWNHGAEKIFGYTAEEMLGHSASILFPQGTDARLYDITQSIRRGQRVEVYEAERRRKDGQLVTISVSVSPIFDRYGTIIGASKIARDISEKKKLERRLLIITEQLHAVLQSTQDFVIALDDQWRITYANRLPWGADADTAIERNLWEFYPRLCGTAFDTEFHRALRENVSVQFDEYSAAEQDMVRG